LCWHCALNSNMSFALTGKSSILAGGYFPARFEWWRLRIRSDRLWNLLYNNVNSSDKFYFNKDDKEIVISEGLYELHNLDKYLKRAISNNVTRKKTLRKNEDDESKYPLIIRTNNNTTKSEIKCAYRINFTKPHNIGLLLGFS